MSNQAATIATSGKVDIIASIRVWGKKLGFQEIGFTGIDLGDHREHLKKWLDAGYHGEMAWMEEHKEKRENPSLLIPKTVTIITARMDYLPPGESPGKILEDPKKAYISRYALGRDYHKLMRRRLAKLARRIEAKLDGGRYRAFVDSAPVLERALAEKSGIGWIGKNTMLLNEKAGSWFFLGEIYTDIPLPQDPPKQGHHCGTCSACLEICPTKAFTQPWVLDARKCISYLTIEHKGIIPEHLRPLMGNRIYGCDDCQLACPWNKFAIETSEKDFAPRSGLDSASLIDLSYWDEATFFKKTEGSPIKRLGFERWRRNIAIAMGNAPPSIIMQAALSKLRIDATPLIKEHIDWALERHSGATD